MTARSLRLLVNDAKTHCCNSLFHLIITIDRYQYIVCEYPTKTLYVVLVRRNLFFVNFKRA